MYNLIKTEFYKLKRQKLLAVLFIAVIAISAFSAFSEMSLSTSGEPVSGKMSFTNAVQDIFMLFVIAVFAGFYIGSDFSNRTIQAELSKGHRRSDVVFSKAFVFSIIAGLMMLLYPVTVCLIHVMQYGWGEPFSMLSVLYLLRVALLGFILNMGTASIYVCFAFLCRDIPRTICVCFAFPVAFSAISGTLGKQVPALGKLFEYSTLSQLKYIVNDNLKTTAVIAAAASACITVFAALLLSSYIFSKAEIR